MATILYVSTYGSDDPTRATLAIITALGALEARHEVQLALLGEATYLMKPGVADNVCGVGLPPLGELLQQIFDAGVPIHVCKPCGESRGILEEDLRGKNAQFSTPVPFAEAVVKADRVVSF